MFVNFLGIRNIVLCGKKCFEDRIEKIISNKFWKDVLRVWLYFYENLIRLYYLKYCFREFFFFNENILIEEEIKFYENWLKNNIVFVNDVLDENGFVMKLDDFKIKYGIKF